MTKNKRKLIFFWSYLEWGGAQIYFMAIMKEAMSDWDVVAVLPRHSSPEIIRFLDQIGVKCEFLDFHLDLGTAPTVKRKVERQWSRVRAEAASLRFLRRYDLGESVLHIETAPWQSWIFLTLLSLKKANVFVTMHNAVTTTARWRRLVWRARMQFVSRLPGFHIFASNKDTKNRIRHLVAPAFWESIAVTYTCVDPKQISGVLDRNNDVASIRRRHGFRERDFIVLCVGQFIDRKGRWIYLDAAKSLVKDGANIKFVWLTPVPPSEFEKKRIAAFDLGDSFRMMLSGDIGDKREDILEFFRIADIFALPSFVEGLPIALIEASALGLPCISTNVYAIPEAIENNVTGILIEPGDAAALAQAILKLKNDAPLRHKLAENGRKFVLKNFDQRLASQIAIAKYKECFTERGYDGR